MQKRYTIRKEVIQRDVLNNFYSTILEIFEKKFLFSIVKKSRPSYYMPTLPIAFFKHPVHGV